MPTLTTDQRTAVASNRLMRRDFLWVDSDPAVGFWSDVGNVTVDGKLYLGAGLAGSAALTRMSDLSIPSLTLTLSGVSDAVLSAVRGETLDQIPITLSIGLFDPESHDIIGPLIQVFTGKIDDVDIKTPV